MASSLAYAGYILALIGGIIILIYGVLDILGTPFFAFSALSALGGITLGIVEVIIGIICIAGSKFVSHLGWAIVLLILGIIVGGIGGILVVVGALLGLISHFT